MSSVFTILWVEDKEGIIRHQTEPIKKHLAGLGYELILLPAKDKEEFEKYIDSESNIDVVVTDFAISDGFNGLQVVQKIRSLRRTIDVLFYSAQEDTFKDEKIFTEIGRYGLVITWDSKDVEEPLKELIDKNLRKYQNIVFLRGFFISEVIDLELKLNEFFANYFQIHSDLREEFHDYVLEGSYIPLEGKKKVLSKILDKYKIKDDTRFQGMVTKISNIADCRNKLAHCKVDPGDPTTLISAGEPCRLKREDLKKLLLKINTVSSQIDRLTQFFNKTT
jgi:hypothetical protein